MKRQNSQNPNNFTGSDIERINAAVQATRNTGDVVEISARKPDQYADRNYWLIDSAILLPENTTLILLNCTIKLSDQCRDNFIRSQNCGIGITDVRPLDNIHILGIGNACLIGADHPRASGDSGKKLTERTFGTDSMKTDQSPYGDWRNIGILLAYVSHFSIHNIKIIDSHCWAISLEYCTYGDIQHIAFKSTGWKLIDGKKERILNQDGLDLRRGCKNITIDNITGFTGDDLIALTALKSKACIAKKSGDVNSTEVCRVNPDDATNTVCNISIRGVHGYSAGHCQIIRFLNNGVTMHHVLLNDVIDSSPELNTDHATIRIGDHNPAWGGVNPLGTTYGFQINNIMSNSKHCILIAGSLTDSRISNVLNFNPDVAPITFESGKEYTKNLMTNTMMNATKQTPFSKKEGCIE